MPQYHLSGINQGSTYSLLLRAVDISGNAIDLTNYTLRSSIRVKYTDTVNISQFDLIKVNASNGIFNVALTATGAAAIPAAVYLYDIEAALAAEADVIKLMYGYCYVHPQISF